MAMRKADFGFTPSEIPMTGELYIPDYYDLTSSQPVTPPVVKSPLVAIVHGSHFIPGEQFSGYRYIASRLASSGYATLLIDQNFLNDRWSGALKTGEMEARAWTLLCHLDLVRQWNNDSTSSLFNRLDLNNVTLIGHSRGGRAVTLAYAYNKIPPHGQDKHFDFNITGIIEIAPYDSFQPINYAESYITDIDYMLILGGQDSDVYYASGMETYNKSIMPTENHWKTAIYIPGATHSGFNSNCKHDRLFPFTLLEESQGHMHTAKQQELTSELISTFLDASIRKDTNALSDLSNIGLTQKCKYGTDIISTMSFPSQSVIIEDFEEYNDNYNSAIIDILQRDKDCTPAGNRMYRLGQDSIVSFDLSLYRNIDLETSVKAITFDLFLLPNIINHSIPNDYTDNHALKLIIHYPGSFKQFPRTDTVYVAESHLIPQPHFIKLEKGLRNLTIHPSRDYEIFPQTIRIPLNADLIPDSLTFSTASPVLIDNVGFIRNWVD